MPDNGFNAKDPGVVDEEQNTENVNARLEQSWLMECLDEVMQEMVEEEG